MPVVDCDVHPYVNGIGQVLKHMSAAWRQRFADHDLRLSGFAHNRYINAMFGRRPDAVPPGGGVPGSDPVYAARDLLDRWEVEIALLLALQAGSTCAWPDPRDATVLVGALNQHFIEAWLPVDPRYRYAVAVTSHDPGWAAAEVRRHAENPAVAAVLLMLTDIPLGAKHHYPIFDAAREASLPIVIHPTGAEGLYSGTAPLAGGAPRSYAEWHGLAPQVGQSALASILFSGALESFPDLRLVFTEYGFTWLPPLLWRLDMEWRNFRGDVPWMKRSPSDYVRSHIRFTTQPMEDPERPADFATLLRLMDAEHLLLFSSDYPHYDEDNPDVVTARFPPELRERVCRLNALDILRLAVPADA